MAIAPNSYRILRQLSAAALFGVVLAACTVDKDLATDTNPGSTGDTSTTGPDTSTMGPDDPTGTGSTGDPDEGDFVAMEMCRLPVVCEPVTHSFAESAWYHPEGEDILPGEVCVWTGMRDGTPGRYTYTTDHEFGNGHQNRTYLIHVHEGRKVTFAAEYQGFFEGGDGVKMSSGFDPALTCTLAEPAFFEQCLTNFDFEVHADCAWTDDWWVDCVEEGPKCE